MDHLIRKVMDTEAMEMETPGRDLVAAARKKVAARKPALPPDNRLFDWFFLLRHKLRFYQLGATVLLTCLCLFYSIEVNLESRSTPGFSNYSPNSLSIKNTTISVNSPTILTSIPTLRN